VGEHGTRALLPALGPIDMALVGEPTRMRAAVGERGLVVLDCTAHGRAGHAARDEGINALYVAADTSHGCAATASNAARRCWGRSA